MTLGIASYIKLWYSPRAVHTIHNAENLQQTCKKLLKKITNKKLAKNLQRTSKQLAKNLQRTSKKLMQRMFPKAKSQAAYSILRRDSNRNKPPAIKAGEAVLALAHSDKR